MIADTPPPAVNNHRAFVTLLPAQAQGVPNCAQEVAGLVVRCSLLCRCLGLGAWQRSGLLQCMAWWVM